MTNRIEWKGPFPPGENGCSYDHLIGVTPIGRFLITWKSWKEEEDASVDETPWGEFGNIYGTVEECREAAEKVFWRKVQECMHIFVTSPEDDDTSLEINRCRNRITHLESKLKRLSEVSTDLVYYSDSVARILADFPGKAEALENRLLKVAKELGIKKGE